MKKSEQRQNDILAFMKKTIASVLAFILLFAVFGYGRVKYMMNVEKEFTLKQLIENEGFVVILDTNILLNIYRYSPDYSEYALNCLTEIKDSIFLPSIVRMEYGKHCRGDYAKMNNRIRNAKANIQKEIVRIVNNDKMSVVVIIDDAHLLSREILLNLKA